MEWLAENWVLVALFGGMAAMHLFGHRHGHGKKHGSKTKPDIVAQDTAQPRSDNPSRDEAAPDEKGVDQPKHH